MSTCLRSFLQHHRIYLTLPYHLSHHSIYSDQIWHGTNGGGADSHGIDRVGLRRGFSFDEHVISDSSPFLRPRSIGTGDNTLADPKCSKQARVIYLNIFASDAA